MWIASKYGWFSIVQKDGHFHIRARVERDLELLAEAAVIEHPIETWHDADYRYRIRIPVGEAGDAKMARVFAQLANSIDYSNFKTEIARTPSQRGKLSAYHDIWGTMMSVQK